MSNDNDPAVLVLPGDPPPGELFVRSRGGKRWTKVGSLSGKLTLDPRKEYKLRLTVVYAPMEVVKELAGVNCDLLTEIEVPILVAAADCMDEAMTGVSWLQEGISAEHARVKAALGTKTRLVFTRQPFDFNRLRG